METENFVGYDLQREYLSTLRATRVASTVLLVFCGAWCWQQYLAVQTTEVMFENMVSGGRAALPALTQFVIENAMALTGLAAMIAFSALAFIWSAARRLSHVILATTIGAGLPGLAAVVIGFALNRPLHTVFTTFGG